MFWNEEIYRQTISFAAKAHASQKILGMDIPYLKHLAAVTMEVASAILHTPEANFDIDFAIQCGLLHDTIEDTYIKYDEIEISFGKKVADGVLALTKNESLPKENQMMDSLERILLQPKEVRVVKICDRIDNLYSPPIYWTPEKRKYYQKEGQLILDTLQGVCPYAEARLQAKINAYSNYF
ncbi:MAG: bifunctional (p)ppGpp synthetase/guanosine-3',5'-bis(diphosphate) 3'-pyrophosphohydrolase [Cytophagia bacterium]|nr:MAG: bifunctional (p)ppGpp synthetase/guanosine-3',5'-bis(diphosphate) 3'-pyrophosphohydrolase [Cytophagia bacterium]TAG42350.1 MAG: bifunctional (p)ppGpp synthetase/guanosine-3',5'-bis(diphosphate) 3'-pyrophosphohydrolase [Cytophagia bacterium]